jgi:polyphosphate kinase
MLDRYTATDPAFIEPGGKAAPVEVNNRDLSWLEFNRRVLNEAIDDRNPLLERVRFLGIFTSNLDEFFMKRVGALKRQMISGALSRTPDGRTAAEVLAALRASLLPMLHQQAECWTKTLKPALAQHGINVVEWEEMKPGEQEVAHRYFSANVFPVLTPLAVDPGSPFPFISNLSTSLGVVLHHPDGEELFARVKVPEVLPKWINVSAPGEPHRFVSLHEMIRHNLHDLFPDMTIIDVMLFRVTRNADIERDEEDAEDLRQLMEDELRARKFAQCVRMEHGPNPNLWIRQFLMEELDLTDLDVYEMPNELDYEDLRPIAELNLPALRFDPWTPTVPMPLADDESDIFAVIRAGDLMVHHPYESFAASVERFVKAAAADPKVLAIKMTLYRTGDASPFINTLIRAAESGKQVVCLVELKARFDEERNIQLASRLEKAGVHVVYGVVGLKTHTKTTLVVREDADGIRCYAHIGTGNYHTGTSRLYTDLGLFTCDPDITRDLVELFHYLTGRSLKRTYRRLLVAPANMRDRFLELINREIENAKAGKPAHIVGKMNSLEERKIIHALYDASRAGVKVDLIVRGFCCLKPGVPGVSENIRVISVIGRFLEHSRIFYFRNAAPDPVDGEYYIGSADWMYRNLLARVEAIVPIDRRPHRERLWDILNVMLRDQRQAWDMQSDGSYIQRKPTSTETSVGTHVHMMTQSRSTALSREELTLLK